jgi:5-methyltetrahydropteroyltriglutamate--homocysteine methyltransferase
LGTQMKRSTHRILTTHVGRLERPDTLTDAMIASPSGRPTDPAFKRHLSEAVTGVVSKQDELGVDVVCDGEFGKLSWNTYLYTRLGGHELKPVDLAGSSGRTTGHAIPERKQFAAFYEHLDRQGHHYAHRSPGKATPPGTAWICTGPVTYTGQEALKDDLENLKAACDKAGVTEAFVPATSPVNLLRGNSYYANEEDYFAAVGEAMREEYKAIIDAGFILQIDDPQLVSRMRDTFNDIQAFRKHAEAHVEIVNHALRDLPEDRIRCHICWGSWHGPHTDDVPLEDIVDIMLNLKVQAYVFEAANARHEHEWQIWKNVKLPDGKILIPGVVSHSTNVVEHPDLVAWRLANFCSVVGRENVIAGTDCGLGYRVHPQIAEAKLLALSEGARRASIR